MRIIPRTIEQIIEGHCPAEDWDSVLLAIDPAEAQLILERFSNIPLMKVEVEQITAKTNVAG